MAATVEAVNTLRSMLSQITNNNKNSMNKFINTFREVKSRAFWKTWTLNSIGPIGQAFATAAGSA